jgi:IS30 family transposase
MKKTSYGRLSYEEREEISRCLASGLNMSKIAVLLKRHRSTIGREIQKGSCNRYTYRAGKAQKRATRNASKRKKYKRKLYGNKRLERFVRRNLKERWSPEQIAEKLKIEYPTDMSMRISPDSIYMYVYVMPKGMLKEELLRALRHKHRRRRKKRGERAVTIKEMEDMIGIDERPKEVETRTIPGHWEGDLMIGKNRKSAIGTIVERKTRLLKIVRLKNKTSKEVKNKFAREFKKIPEKMRLSMTYDQGREMAQHKALSRAVKMTVYFAHKASPWERGTNENTNGLLRQYFPKGTDFNKVSLRELKQAERQMNDRPRKTLGWKSPKEAYFESVALNS